MTNRASNSPTPEVRARNLTSSLVLYVLLPLVVICYPILLQIGPTNLVASSYGKSYRQFEFFGFSMSCYLIFLAYLNLRKLPERTFKNAVPTLLFTLVAFHFLAILTESSHPSYDYKCYAAGAQAILMGKNPYAGTGYIYPPLTAEALAWLYRTAHWIGKTFGVAQQPFSWDIAFYFYQTIQFMLLLVAYRLSSRFCRTIGFSTFNAAMLTAALFLFNTALLRTIHLNQVNLWLLILVFLTFLYATKNPIIAGLSISIAFHIKLYPAALLIPLLFMKCYRTVLWAGLGILGIFLLQTNFGSAPEVWVQFLRFAPFFPRGTAFRDNSIHSLVLNSLGLSNLMDVNTKEFYTAIQIVVAVLSGLLLFWFVKRYRKREGFFRIRGAVKGTDRPAIRRLFGHMNDALAATLLLSPLVWDHHYIILLPMIICGFKWAPRQIKWKIGVASFLILTLPVFDIYPFSYHRLVGLLALVYWMDPLMFSIERDQSQTSVPVKDGS